MQSPLGVLYPLPLPLMCTCLLALSLKQTNLKRFLILTVNLNAQFRNAVVPAGNVDSFCAVAVFVCSRSLGGSQAGKASGRALPQWAGPACGVSTAFVFFHFQQIVI